MQSIFGAILAAGYASAFAPTVAGAPAADQQVVTDNVAAQLEKSFAGAADTARQYPQYASQIVEAARHSFVSGSDGAYLAGIAAIVLGAALVFFMFPKKDPEEALLARYAAEDSAPVVAHPATATASARRGVPLPPNVHAK